MALGFRIPNEALGGIADMGAAPVTPTSEPASPKMEMPDYTKISGITPETRDALATRQAIVGDTEQQYLQALRSKGELESAQALATAQAEATRSRGKANVIADFAKQESDSQELKNLEEAEKAARMSEFVPSKENAQDLAQLFGLISAIGFAIGAGGKSSAMQAMSAMNGMLEGHRLGREDLYKKEKDLFDINLKKLMKTVEISKAAYERYRALASTKREAAIANLDADFSAAGADFLKKYSKQFGDAKTVDVLNALLQMKNKVAETVEKERLNAEAKAARLQSAKQTAQERAASQRELLRMRLGIGVGTSGLVEAFTGVSLPDKEAKPIADAASAIGESRQLQQLVKQTPGIVGREGQMRQFVDRYVKSALSGEPVPTDQQSGIDDERALLFAKRYASYLVNYERSLAPGARGFTVFFQKRFNDLMSPNQFNASGMISLLEDQQREIANQSTKVDRRFNRQNLTEMGDDIASRSLSSNVAPAASPSQSVTVNGKTYTKPANFTDEQWEKYKKDVGGK